MDTNERERSNVESPKTSRRTFLATAAGAAGAVGAGGALLGRSAEAASVAFAAAPLATRSYSTTRELLYLDGAPIGFITGRSGGLAFVEMPTQVTTASTEIKAPVGTVKFEPLVLQFGAGMPTSIYQWIVDSMQLKGVRKSGFIAFVGFDGAEGGRLNFTNAVISEVTLPALDAASKDPAALTITLVPEFTQLFLSPPTPVKHTIPLNTKAKSWLSSSFRMRIDKIDSKVPVAIVEEQTTTIRLQTAQPGTEKFVTAVPVGIENGKLVISVREPDARQFLDWFNQLWSPKNPGDPAQLRSATLEYVTLDLATVLGAVTFKNVGISKVAPEQMSATDTIRRVKIEMYVGSVSLDAKGLAA